MCNNEVLQRRLLRTADFGELLGRVYKRKGNHIRARQLFIESYTIRREVAALKAMPSTKTCPNAGDIGKPIRHVELPGEEPLTVPSEFPEEAPEEAPVEAPAEPEKVPA